MFTSILRFQFSAALVFVCLTTFAVSPPPKEGGQAPSPTKSPTATPKPTPAGAIDEKLFSGMQWRQIGPFRGGRAGATAAMVFFERRSGQRFVSLGRQRRDLETFGRQRTA